MMTSERGTKLPPDFALSSSTHTSPLRRTLPERKKLETQHLSSEGAVLWSLMGVGALLEA
jgi:hypothetical protein